MANENMDEMFIKTVYNFVYQVNTLMDHKELRDKIEFNQARDQVDAENIIDFLKENFGDNIDFSLYDKNLKDKFNKEMSDVSDVYLGRERKIGVRNNGLCLILAYGLEVLFRAQAKKILD